MVSFLGINSTSIAFPFLFIIGMKDSSVLLDKLNSAGSDGNSDINRKFLFPEHLSPVQINAGIRSKNLYQGVFYLSRTNFQEGTVNCEAFDQPILIQGLYFFHFETS